MTRIYDHSGEQKCMICYKVPDFGHLYRCTQDTNGDLPVSEFIDQELSEEDMSTDLAGLSVDNEVDNQATASEASNDTTKNPTPEAQTLKAMIYTEGLGDDNDAAVDEELARAFDGKRKFETAFPPKAAPQAEACNLKICHNCRPVYKDRAWESLTRIADKSAKPPPTYELDNRRVSNATTVSGIRVPSDAYPHPVTGSTSTAHVNAHATIGGYTPQTRQVSDGPTRVNAHAAIGSYSPQARQVSDSNTRVNARETIGSYSPQMRQVGDSLNHMFVLHRGPLVVRNNPDPPVDEGASDADDEKGSSHDDSNDTDTSDADSSYHFARSAGSPTGNYNYASVSATRPRSGTVVHHEHPVQASYGSIHGEDTNVGDRLDVGQASHGRRGIPTPGRFIVD